MSRSVSPRTLVDLVVRARPVGDREGGNVTHITPASAGWAYSGLQVHDISGGSALTVDLGHDEGLVLPLRGSCDIRLVEAPGTSAHEVHLAGRTGPLAGPSDALYAPLGSRLEVTASAAGTRVAIATAQATRALPVRTIRPDEVRVDVRGAGACTRQVNNYTLGTDVEVDHLLVCEVITPAGNWSSYPPHRHEEHAEDERELEEIYYFEVSDGPAGEPGLAYHRVYGTTARPIDLVAEVRTGDVVLVPYGYHGPTMAAPGYDLYYLNVMAGPAEDRQWLSVDDPAHHWVRDTWATTPADPRLPVGPASASAIPPETAPAHRDGATTSKERS